MHRKRKPTWEIISRAIGIVIILVLLTTYTVAAFDRKVHPDRYVSLSLLGIAAALVGVPSGYRLIVSRDG